MHLRPLARAAALVFLPAVAVECEGTSKDSSDAAAEASKTVPVYDAAQADVTLPTCGDAACTEPPLGALGEAACCLPSEGCGLRSLVLDTACLPRATAVGADLSCPGRSFPGAVNLAGCCGADGRCGLLDSEGELGCVTTAADAALCNYDPNNDCTSVVELPCDGPEDCPTGKVCCGRAQRDRYDAFGCFTSCDGIVDDHGGVWLEICHPRHACLNPRYTCERRGTLPSFLASCREPAPPAVMDAGRVSPTDASPGDASLGDASVGDASLSDVGSDRSESIPPHIGFVPVVEVTDLLPFGPLPRGVACGQATCKEGEKCCLRTHASSGTDAGATARQPIDAYCARVDAKCSCLPEVDR